MQLEFNLDEQKRSAKFFTNLYIDHLNVGDKFTPRQVVGYIGNMFLISRGYHYSPHDGTILRYMRERREKKGDLILVDHAKSIYQKKERV